MLPISTTLVVLTVLAAPEWAGPANTFLLIILSVVTYKLRGKVDKVHEDVSSAAAAALAAAEASAHAAVASHDAARVAKDIGGHLRKTERPAILPPEIDS